MPKNVLAAFGTRVREHREKRGWSQEELAHRADVDVSYLSEIERGKVEPCLNKMKDLAEAFGISLAEIVRGI